MHLDGGPERNGIWCSCSLSKLHDIHVVLLCRRQEYTNYLLLVLHKFIYFILPDWYMHVVPTEGSELFMLLCS